MKYLQAVKKHNCRVVVAAVVFKNNVRSAFFYWQVLPLAGMSNKQLDGLVRDVMLMWLQFLFAYALIPIASPMKRQLVHPSVNHFSCPRKGVQSGFERLEVFCS